MSFNTWLKSRVTDRVLLPVRRAVAGMVPPGARVLELGFGTGDLLFRLSGAIREGVGLDIDDEMIRHARSRATAEGVANLRFEHFDITGTWDDLKTFDVATATLVIHELPEDQRVAVLREMGEAASWVIIADYVTDMPFLNGLYTHFDEFLSGHHGHYVTYERSGGMQPLLEAAGLHVENASGMLVGGIRVWKCLLKDQRFSRAARRKAA